MAKTDHLTTYPVLNPEVAEALGIEQLDRLTEFLDWCAKHDPELDDDQEVSLNGVDIAYRPHNGDPNETRSDITAIYLSADIVAQASIDCYGNGDQMWGYIDWVCDGSEDCQCDECTEGDDDA